MKIALAAVAAIALALQLIPVERTNPPVSERIAAPDSVMDVLRDSCFDCHSHDTQWPWYAYVAPASWLVTGHVNHAREHLNFSTWDAYDAEERREKFEETWEEVEKGEMPLRSYLRLHRDARLTERDRAVIEAWTSSALATLETSPLEPGGSTP
jgi:hypothetical protein